VTARFLKSSIEKYRIHPAVAGAIALLPFPIVLGSIILRETPATRHFMKSLMAENHAIESMTFALLLVAGILGLRLARMLGNSGQNWFHRAFYAAFGVGLIFVSMEEISWGQTFFSFDTPEAIKSINKQNEMNFHNLKSLHAPFELLRVLFGVGGLLGIICSRIKWTKPIGAPPMLAFWFIAITILAALDLRNYYVSYTERSIYGIAAGQVEVLELLIGCAAFFYMWLNGRRIGAPCTCLSGATPSPG
jgi:hypothetical protein